MPFTVPTIDELHAFLLALTKALLPPATPRSRRAPGARPGRWRAR